ncbi:MAG: DUF58 domain-containing protein [Planctomycetota bacterium]|jgi:uncharacterized protein (DUF58 family)
MTMPTTYRYLPPALVERLHGMNLRVQEVIEGPRQGGHRSPHFGSSVEFAEYRAYAKGDEVRSIDWNVYARSDRLVVRRYLEETSLQARILLDTSGSLAYRGHGEVTKFDYAATLAAGFLFLLTSQGDSAGLTLFDDSLHTTYEPVSTQAGMKPILEGLETVTPRGEGDIRGALHALGEALTRRSLVILLSDLLQEPEEILDGVRRLRHDGHSVTVFHILDRDEQQIPWEGMVEVESMENGERLILEADELRALYVEEVGAFCDLLRRGCSSVQAGYFQVETTTPADTAIAMRAQRR